MNWLIYLQLTKYSWYLLNNYNNSKETTRHSNKIATTIQNYNTFSVANEIPFNENQIGRFVWELRTTLHHMEPS